MENNFVDEKNVWSRVSFVPCEPELPTHMLADLASTTENERRSMDSLVTDSDEEDTSSGWPGLPFLQFQKDKPKIPRREKEKKMLVKAQNDILKFNRMGTHLANERTLLAWVSSTGLLFLTLKVRTAGSLFTLAVAFLKIESIQDLVLGIGLFSPRNSSRICSSGRFFADIHYWYFQVLYIEERT